MGWREPPDAASNIHVHVYAYTALCVYTVSATRVLPVSTLYSRVDPGPPRSGPGRSRPRPAPRSLDIAHWIRLALQRPNAQR